MRYINLHLHYVTLQWTYHTVWYAHCHIFTRQRLQRVQNCAARLVLSAPPRSSYLRLLQQLHWLPIEARVSYKLCCLMYWVVHRAAPSYLTEVCEPCLDNRLRSTLFVLCTMFFEYELIHWVIITQNSFQLLCHSWLAYSFGSKWVSDISKISAIILAVLHWAPTMYSLPRWV